MYPALLQLMCTHRMPVVDSTDAPADLNGLVLFAERRNLVSARVPSHFKRILLIARPSHHGLALFQVGDGGDSVQVWSVAANMLHVTSMMVGRGWSSSVAVGRGNKNSLL